MDEIREGERIAEAYLQNRVGVVNEGVKPENVFGLALRNMGANIRLPHHSIKGGAKSSLLEIGEVFDGHRSAAKMT